VRKLMLFQLMLLVATSLVFGGMIDGHW